MNRGYFVYLHTNFQLAPNNMKRFPTCMLLDYIGFGLATMAILLLSKPFNVESSLLRNSILQQSVEECRLRCFIATMTQYVLKFLQSMPRQDSP